MFRDPQEHCHQYIEVDRLMSYSQKRFSENPPWTKKSVLRNKKSVLLGSGKRSASPPLLEIIGVRIFGEVNEKDSLENEGFGSSCSWTESRRESSLINDVPVFRKPHDDEYNHSETVNEMGISSSIDGSRYYNRSENGVDGGSKEQREDTEFEMTDNGSYCLVDRKSSSVSDGRDDQDTSIYNDHRMGLLKSIIVDEKLINYTEKPAILGYGTYSTVYKGTFFDRKVAVKKFNKSLEPESNKEHFIHEGLITLQLRHPNIIQLLGVISYDKTHNHALIFEYMNLGALESYIADPGNCIDVPFVLTIAKNVALGLRHLHDCNVVHMDIKSSNVLLSSVDGSTVVAKLADLGFAQKLAGDATSESKMSSIRGTPSWMAPEILVKRKKMYVYPSADVYSFGILLWQLIERKKPYKNLSIADVYGLKSRNHHPQIGPIVPAAFKEILKDCWHNNPFERPKMRCIIQKLDAIIYDVKKKCSLNNFSREDPRWLGSLSAGQCCLKPPQQSRKIVSFSVPSDKEIPFSENNHSTLKSREETLDHSSEA